MQPKISSLLLLGISVLLSPAIALTYENTALQFSLVGAQIACIAVAATSMRDNGNNKENN
jgi:hypothetical protein